MRPKKKILIVDSNELRLMERRFVLNNGIRYRVYSAATREAALTAAVDFDVELIIVTLPLAGAEQLLAELHSAVPFARTLVLAEGAKEPPALLADMVLCGRPSTAELLESAYMLSLRKRGPRKMSPEKAAPGSVERLGCAIARRVA